MSEVLRTPDECFRNLPDFPFAPHYRTVDGGDDGPLRMHYLDEGPADAPVVLMLHGEPSWCYLYRKVIPPLVESGYRVIAPDHIGFGRSDKLPRRSDYRYQCFVDWLHEFVVSLDLRRITLVAQDWGGPIGLRVLTALPGRFERIAVANTLLPNAEPPPRGVPDWPGETIENWVAVTRDWGDIPVADIVAGVCVNPLPPAVKAAYDAPFPDARYKAAVLEFPSLIPLREGDAGLAENRATWEVLRRWDKPLLTAFSDGDPSTRAWETVFREQVPGARGQPHTVVEGAGHFLQEEQPEALARALLAFLRD